MRASCGRAELKARITGGGGGLVFPRLFGNTAAEQEVVDGDDAAGTHEAQAAFVVMRGGGFVGVDKGNIVAVGASGGEEFVEGKDGRLQVQADFVRHARVLPGLAGVFGVGGVDVAGGDAAVFGQGEGDGGAAVAGEHADFEAAFGADELHEKGEELGLLGGQVHFAHTVLRGGLAQVLQYFCFGRVDAFQVACKAGGQMVGDCGHGAARDLVGIVGVGFFGDFAGGEIGLLFGVELDIPQQAAVLEAAFLLFGVFFDVFLQELGGVGLVVIHGVFSCGAG